MPSGNVERNTEHAGELPSNARNARLPSASDTAAALSPIVDAREIGRRDPRGMGWLIRDVSLAINPGDRLALVGTTGSGKTVLLRALALLDPLDSGSIEWQGRAVGGESVPTYRTQAIYLHQRPSLVDGTVEDNLLLPFSLEAHHAKQFDRARSIELLRSLGRPETFLAKSSRDLSGGEAQLVALIRAIQLDPAILLLDEPTASLDSAAASDVEQLVERWFLAGHGRRAFVWVSHDPEQARRVGSRRLHMHAGRIENED
jgi:putative ABC transport system ATP-binding protein